METTRPSLLIRVRNRQDQAAWEEFDGLYRPMLHHFALARGLNPTEAEEIAQQCMTAVCEHIAGFEYDPGKGRFKGWLKTLVSNRIKNMLRGRHQQQAESQDFKRPQEREESPDDIFDQCWRQEHLKHCLRLIRTEVEETTFQAFVAYVMKEEPIERVCAELKMTANQVHAIKSRMIKRLRERMIELLGEEE